MEDIGLQISDLDLRLPGISSLAGGCSVLPLVVQRPLDVDAHRDQARDSVADRGRHKNAVHGVCLAPSRLDDER